jgi:hypothetical protein
MILVRVLDLKFLRELAAQLMGTSTTALVDTRTTVRTIDALHFQVEGNRDIAHRVHLLPIRRSQLFSGKNSPTLADMGAAPHRARA